MDPLSGNVHVAGFICTGFVIDLPACGGHCQRPIVAGHF
jgi:hypothetical protein